MIRRFVQVAAVTGAALALMSSAAGATPVTESSAPGVLACHSAAPPTQTPGWAHGRGFGSCVQSVDVFLQRHRAWDGSSMPALPRSAISAERRVHC
ncbi:hypothetical protein BBK82_42855 [Lentzea guizhouensis]|uniref:Secreted protein n=1 Tax=Lentzea guizhouensis TaxID=1586287 RepID=A0A1B2HVD5_9PSEU|nr:hypothetical protein BBK82_42855 [Lentzea guizhouensis]